MSAHPNSTRHAPTVLLFSGLLLVLAGLVTVLEPQPPAPVGIQDWSAARNVSPEGATRVVAEVDFGTQLVLTYDGQPAFAMPLVTPGSDGAEVLGALVYPGLRTLDPVRLDTLLAGLIAMGARGPVLELPATVAGATPFAGSFANAMAAEGRRLAADAPVLMLRPVAPGVPWAMILLGLSVVCAVCGVGLRLVGSRGQTSRIARAAGTHHRIQAYIPTMATQEDGATALARAIAPHVAPLVENIHEPVVVPPAPPRAVRQTPGSAVFSAVKLGQGCAEELKLSRRASARLAADPFVQRLGKLN